MTKKRNAFFLFFLTGYAALSGIACKPSASPAVAKASPKPDVAHAVLPRTAAAPAFKTLPPLMSDLSHWKCTGKEVERGDPKSKEIALTFDADWSAQYTIPIINALKARHYRATFFITGHFCRTFPKETKALAEAHMEIGSHSNTHPYFVKINDAKIGQELDGAESAFRELLGHGTRPLFRFPYGESDKRSRSAVASHGFQPIYWSLDSLDAFRAEKSPGFIFRRITPRMKAGDIILMHVSSRGSAEALPSILKVLEKRGLKVVPVSEFLKSG